MQSGGRECAVHARACLKVWPVGAQHLRLVEEWQRMHPAHWIDVNKSD
jgi:hypothetical protein